MQAAYDVNVPLPAARSGFWRRFGAFFVDAIVVGIVNGILGRILGTPGIPLELAFSLGYFTWFHGRTGQTPGDIALGVKVVDLRSGRAVPIGYGRAAIRWLVSIPSFLALLIGYLWMLWDGEKQTWHDKAAGSVVVPVDEL